MTRADRTIPPCPKCGRSHRVVRQGFTMLWCQACSMGFDNEPANDGPLSSDPVKNAILKEERSKRK